MTSRILRADALAATAAARLTEAVVASAVSLPVSALRGAGRGGRRVQTARRTAIYLAHVGFGLSLSRTGICFGRDRTTVRHACAGAEDDRDDPRVDFSLTALETGMAALSLRLASGAAR